MARILHGGEPVLNIINGNFILAHLQCAAYERFRTREGFFVTFFGGTDDAGRPVAANSLWFDPTMPFRIVFDEYEEPVQIRRELVDIYLQAMNRPIGVVIGPPDRDFVPPFTLEESAPEEADGQLGVGPPPPDDDGPKAEG